MESTTFLRKIENDRKQTYGFQHKRVLQPLPIRQTLSKTYTL